MSTAESLYRLPASLQEDLDQLQTMTGQFRQGAIPAARYQAFRVPLGIYEQRESGTFMLRVRLPAGMVLPSHMRALAGISQRHGDGILHVTTRQDIQIHRVPLENLHAASVELVEAGLSTKGGGGNTVRNIAGCPHAGVCPHEVFDITPHVVSMTEAMLEDPLSYQLPRKFKIAFSGCGLDCAAATVSDVGFIARANGEPGFAVYTGGGMGAHSRVAELLEEFIPASQATGVAEAVKRVFDQHGNRKNKHRARLRFLVDELGIEAFRDLYRAELAAAAAPAAGAHVSQAAGPDDTNRPVPRCELPAQELTGVVPQKQPGHYAVEISPPSGMIGAGTLFELAALVERHGERLLRATNRQSLVLRWVSQDELARLQERLARLGLGGQPAPGLRSMVACAGASTCRLGICLSRGMAQAITTALAGSQPVSHDRDGGLNLHISGCPNACGRHPVADIGLYGAARRLNGQLVPHYILQLGGYVEEGRTVLASGRHAIPARNVPAFTVDFLRAFQESPRYPDFAAFLAEDGRTTAQRLAQVHAPVPDLETDPSSYVDWGAREVFSLAGRGAGECGAGVFDLIELDLAGAADALAAGRLFSATAMAARALLVTRGHQANTDVQSLALFRTHFVEAGLVPDNLHGLVDAALARASAPDPEVDFDVPPDSVSDLLVLVRRLYTEMGPSLRVVGSHHAGADK